MRSLPRDAQAYLVLVWCVAAAIGAVTVASSPGFDIPYLLWLPAWIALFVIADYFEVKFEVQPGHDIVMTVYEAILMFWVPVLGMGALPAIVAGSLVTDALHRRPWFRALFNASERTITFSLLVGAYSLLAGAEPHPFAGPLGLVALAVVMLMYFTSNTILVSAVLAFATQTSFWKVVSAAYLRVHWVHFLTLPLGALLAVLWYIDRWLMVVGFLLLLMAHRAFRALAASLSASARAQALALQLEQLQAITTATVSALQPTSVASTVSQRLAELLNAQASWVVLFGPPATRTALHGESPAWLDASTAYLATLQPRAVSLIDPADLAQQAGAPAGMLVGIPMAVEDRVLGVICLYFAGPADLDEATRRVLTAFATQAALVMEHAQMFSALHRQQDELVRSSKLAALGTFAAGIAHEFNNVLAGILGHAQLGRFGADPDEQQEAFRIIEEACVRARKITAGLLTFARRRNPQRRLGMVQDAVDTACLLIQRELIKDDIQLERQVDNVPPTVCDPDQLAQVVLNLLTNARDAIAEAGRAGRIDLRLTEVDGQIELEVRDNGCGIPDELQPQLFQPFVTTKTDSLDNRSGTGLGLAICYGIVEAHGGTITIQSGVGLGTAVTIRIPIVADEGGDEFGYDSADGALQLRILVVDDDPHVLRSVTMLLQRRGHEVQSAPGGVTALRLYQEQTFDLVITDLRMPGMDGLRLIEHLRAIDSSVHVAVMTGQASEPAVQELANANVAVLHKPFTIDELERAIRAKVLDQASV